MQLLTFTVKFMPLISWLDVKLFTSAKARAIKPQVLYSKVLWVLLALLLALYIFLVSVLTSKSLFYIGQIYEAIILEIFTNQMGIFEAYLFPLIICTLIPLFKQLCFLWQCMKCDWLWWNIVPVSSYTLDTLHTFYRANIPLYNK